MKDKNKISAFIFWTPRILSIIFVIFLMMFSLDVFGLGLSAKEIAIGLFIHNIPALILLAVAAISWKHEIVGGVVFLLSGITYVVIVLTIGRFEGNRWLPSLVIGAPAFLIGILFVLNWMKKKTSR